MSRKNKCLSSIVKTKDYERNRAKHLYRDYFAILAFTRILTGYCYLQVSAEPKLDHRNVSPLTSSLSTCDVQSIKDLVSQVVSLTSDTVSSVVALAYCMWLPDLYMCLLSDMEYDVLDNIQQIRVALVDYVQTLQPLLKQISDDVIACASV